MFSSFNYLYLFYDSNQRYFTFTYNSYWSKMYILWIDPGVRKLGYALVQYKDNQKIIIDSGIILDDSSITLRIQRYHKIQQSAHCIKKLYEQYPIDTLAIEKLYFTSRNQSNAEFVYGIRWVLIIQALEHQANLIEIDPVQIKRYITGNGKANKELVQSKIMQLFGLAKKPEYNDSADALGLSYLWWKLQ